MKNEIIQQINVKKNYSYPSTKGIHECTQLNLYEDGKMRCSECGDFFAFNSK